jgi:hypothetical protein
MVPLDQLDPRALMSAAAAEASLDDFGDESFVEGLTIYLQAVTGEARLSDMGVMVIQATMIRNLVNRLRFVDDLKRHPEILDEEIIAPIAILGSPRTGTSKLQRLLSVDPGVQRLDLWRVLNPAPFPGWTPGEPDARVAVAVEFEQMLRQVGPEFMAAHPTLAMEPDEEAHLLDMTFECLSPQLRTYVPSYARWLSTRTGEEPYGYLRNLLQYLQWQDGGGRSRPWILKTPIHVGNLAVLCKTFPDVTVVTCHRDVVETMASFCRLIETVRKLCSDEVDPVALGQELMALWSGEIEKYLLQRDALNGSAEILDVNYREIVKNGTGVAQDIYERRGQVASPEAIQAFVRWEKENPQHRHGRNEYTLETYGLTPAAVQEAFGSYAARFGDVL